MMLGGLAMFLYGIEVMGDGLKNSSGAALKRVLEKVTGNVITGVLTGTLVTAVIQSSTATIVLAVALIGAGVLTLKQAVSIVLGANIGTTITAQIAALSGSGIGFDFGAIALGLTGIGALMTSILLTPAATEVSEMILKRPISPVFDT